MSFFNYEDKKVYYEIVGEGTPLLLIHGNTSSSKLFTQLLPLYASFQVILIDFLVGLWSIGSKRSFSDRTLER